LKIQVSNKENDSNLVSLKKSCFIGGAMAGIIIKPRSRIFHGHDWVYASEIKKTFGNPQPGDVISLKDFRDRPLGTAIYNPESQIVARRISRRKQKLDREFFERRIGQAIEMRERSGIDLRLARLVWSESDALPGMIVDRYGDHVVLQTQTLAMSLHRELISEVLVSLLSPQSVILRNDSPMLVAEGIEQETVVLYGDQPEPFVVTAPTVEGGVQFEIDLLDGQKTGLYLDQLDAHTAIAKLAKGKRVLDCFCNQGGFALACAKAGAASVTAVDSSEPAIQATLRNAELNGVEVNAVKHNAFDFLKHCEDQYDLVILDPPSFTKNKKSLNNAMRGYKEIHLRGIKLLDRDGILATYCCSHHATRELFLQNIVSASVDAKRSLRLIANHAQRLDHPVLPAIPETEYLKGFVLQLIPSR
jgi:23S rRNA (cytosine1962-C5)-methyltransferase